MMGLAITAKLGRDKAYLVSTQFGITTIRRTRFLIVF